MVSSAESGTGASGPHRGERDGNRTRRRRNPGSAVAFDRQVRPVCGPPAPTTPGPRGPRDPTTRQRPPDPLGGGGGEGERHVLAGGHDDHEVGRRPPRAVGALGLPVREVRRLHHHRDAGARHVERDRVVGGADVRDRRPAGSAASSHVSARRARRRAPTIAGPSAVSGRSSAVGSLNHGTAVHSHGLSSAAACRRCRPASARPRTSTTASDVQVVGDDRLVRRAARPSASRRPRRSSTRSAACRRGRARSRPAASVRVRRRPCPSPRR